MRGLFISGILAQLLLLAAYSFLEVFEMLPSWLPYWAVYTALVASFWLWVGSFIYFRWIRIEH